jgi:hypothetical protein
MFHVRKLAEGFVQRGFHYKELNDPEEITFLSESDILYVSNHFSSEFLHRRIASALQRKLMVLLTATKSRLILWNFHTVPDWSALKALPQNVAHLGEDIYAEAVAREPVLLSFRQQFPVVMLRYGAPMHPDFPSEESVERDLDFNFVGHGYQKTMTQHCRDKYNSLILNTPPAISEPLRVNSFRRAQVNLVFHAPSNISKGIVVERFAEALSMGGIIFHDHPRITAEFPDHPAFFYVSTPTEIDDAFAVVMGRNAIERDSMRTASWQSWKQAGLSYFDQAGRILAAFKNNAESGEA